jgi:hypothetical protein
MGCVQLAPGGDEEGRSASGQPDSLGGEETTKGGGGCSVGFLSGQRGERGKWVSGQRRVGKGGRGGDSGARGDSGREPTGVGVLRTGEGGLAR